MDTKLLLALQDCQAKCHQRSQGDQDLRGASRRLAQAAVGETVARCEPDRAVQDGPAEAAPPGELPARRNDDRQHDQAGRRKSDRGTPERGELEDGLADPDRVGAAEQDHPDEGEERRAFGSDVARGRSAHGKAPLAANAGSERCGQPRNSALHSTGRGPTPLGARRLLSEGEVQAKRLVDLEHDRVRNRAQPRPHALDGHGPDLLRLRLRVLREPGVPRGKQDLERIHGFEVRRYGDDRDHAATESSGGEVGPVVADDHGGPTLVRLGTTHGIEVHRMDLAAPYHDWGL